MKVLFIFILFLTTCGNLFATGVVVENNFCNKTSDVISKVLNSTVEIKTFRVMKEDISNNLSFSNYKKSMDLNSIGSGFLISNDGYIVTNNHVVSGSDSIVIYLNGVEYKGEFIGSDFYTDIALLKINIKDSDYLDIYGNNTDYKVGDDVMAIGNPYGFGNSVSKGIISAKNRNIPSMDFFDLIQLDIAINKGNSGGPLIDCNGNLIGINTILYSNNSNGIAFAIPINNVIPTINTLKEFGYIHRGWLGYNGINADKNLFSILNSNRDSGVFVTEVFSGGPADKAKIIPSDIIVSYDNKSISNVSQLNRMIKNTNVDSIVDIIVLRNNKYIKLKVKIKESPENTYYIEENNFLKNSVNFMGMLITKIDENLINKYKLHSGTKGMYILNVAKGSLAEHYGLEVGDIILTINQTQINNKDDYSKVLQNLNNRFIVIVSKKDGKNMLLEFDRNLIGVK